MFMEKNTFFKVESIRRAVCVIGLVAAILCTGTPAMAALDVILPDPFGTTDGLPNTVPFGDGLVYSMKLLDQQQALGFLPLSNGDYQAAVGTGTLDIKILTQGTRANVVTVNGTTWNFEDAQRADSIDFYERHWGNQNAVAPPAVQNPGPVLVKDLLAFLQAVNPNAISPVFFKDMNQNVNADLFFWETIQILDGRDGPPLASWTLYDPIRFSDEAGGFIDPRDALLAHGLIITGDSDIDGPGPDENLNTPSFADNPSDSGTIYTLNNNQQTGGGKPDFAVIFPTMDLTMWADNNNVFAVSIAIRATDTDFAAGVEPYGFNNDGGEEQWINAAAGVAVIPEPASLIIWGLLGTGAGCAGGALAHRRRRRAPWSDETRQNIHQIIDRRRTNA